MISIATDGVMIHYAAFCWERRGPTATLKMTHNPLITSVSAYSLTGRGVIRRVLVLMIAFSIIACSKLPKEQLSKRIHRLAGPEAKDCGTVRLRETPTAVNACAVSEFRNQRPFFARYDGRSIDSSVAHILIRTSAGEMFDVAYDSDPSGGSNIGPKIEPRRLSDCAVVNGPEGEKVVCK